MAEDRDRWGNRLSTQSHQINRGAFAVGSKKAQFTPQDVRAYCEARGWDIGAGDSRLNSHLKWLEDKGFLIKVSDGVYALAAKGQTSP